MRPTIKEVAARARVSVGTVSNVMTGAVPVSPELRARVAAVIQELDYHPNHVARSLKIKQTRMIGMVISDIANPFFPQVIRGAEDAALAHRYLLVTFNTDDQPAREQQVLSVLRSRRVDGLLLVVAPNQGDASHIQAMIDSGIPVVCLDRVAPNVTVDSVTVDNIKGARDCVRHLIDMGHREIGMISGSLGLRNARDRLSGYEEALQESGIGLDPELVREGDFRIEAGYRLSRDLLCRRRPPTALFVSNGMMTVGVLRTLRELALHCPEELALAGFDDLPFSELIQPTLTSVAQPAYEIGYRGAELLIGRIEGTMKEVVPLEIKLEVELKIRQSSTKSRMAVHT
jgi:LacI family transcriptional regulator